MDFQFSITTKQETTMTGDELTAHLLARTFHVVLIDEIERVRKNEIAFLCRLALETIIPAGHDEIIRAIDEKEALGFHDLCLFELRQHVLDQKAEAEAKAEKAKTCVSKVQTLMKVIRMFGDARSLSDRMWLGSIADQVFDAKTDEDVQKIYDKLLDHDEIRETS